MIFVFIRANILLCGGVRGEHEGEGARRDRPPTIGRGEAEHRYRADSPRPRGKPKLMVSLCTNTFYIKKTGFFFINARLSLFYFIFPGLFVSVKMR